MNSPTEMNEALERYCDELIASFQRAIEDMNRARERMTQALSKIVETFTDKDLPENEREAAANRIVDQIWPSEESEE